MGCIQSKVARLSTHEAEEKPPRRRSGSTKATFKGEIQTLFSRKSKVLPPFCPGEEDEEDVVPTESNNCERHLRNGFSRPPWRFGDSSDSEQDQTDSEDEDIPRRVIRAWVHAESAPSQVSRPSQTTPSNGDGAHDTASVLELQPPSLSSPLTVGEESDQQSQASDLEGESAHDADSCPELPRACHSSISLTEEWEDTQSCPEFPRPCQFATLQLTDGCGDGAHTDISQTSQTEGTCRSPVGMSKITVHVEDQCESDLDDDDYSADIESNGSVDDEVLTDDECEVNQPTEHAQITAIKSAEHCPGLVNDTPIDVDVTTPARQADLDETHIDLWPSLLFILWSTQNMAICAILCFVWDRTLRTLSTRLRATERLALANQTGDDMTTANFLPNEGRVDCASGRPRCRCHYVEMDPDKPSTSYPRDLNDSYHFIVKQ